MAADGYLYFTVNQLWHILGSYAGVDGRAKSFVIFRAKLLGGGMKVVLTGVCEDSHEEEMWHCLCVSSIRSERIWISECTFQF